MSLAGRLRQQQLRALTSGSSSSSPVPHGAHHQHQIIRSPVTPCAISPPKPVPLHIHRPPYAKTGTVPKSKLTERIIRHDAASADRMRQAAQLARRALDLACRMAEPGVTTDVIDTAVHFAIIEANAYPSPLNYDGFPKSICSSVNEVICHGIPDARPLQCGDVVSFDVSCFLNGVHGDNCATVIVGDTQEREENGVDWRGVPYRATFSSDEQASFVVEARRLVQATRESLYAAIDTCRPGSCLSEVGAAIQNVADAYGYNSVEKYRGHGICHEFHCAPFVKHFRNNDRLTLEPGMIFTIEPMLTQGSAECFEWDDEWTVSTRDGGLAAQFEHTVLITESSVEILTLPGN
jgi:methionyl aminopeptidase